MSLQLLSHSQASIQ